ncbi:hypothetical protein PRIPAC_92666 [Pristionchus pacificus]|uniref:Uncharacterized protein n=1 Tax=Pristionchus pacificus TaxID=54126 RepID=A0A2A6BNV6_PRIPA|nr:hypothetical protein PRIPAC_92666 [Pristionchus pacificus]|eukprot:PDM67642.1 hypothetical protein PRIPAC_45686 [Pristionchus pacificus]
MRFVLVSLLPALILTQAVGTEETLTGKGSGMEDEIPHDVVPNPKIDAVELMKHQTEVVRNAIDLFFMQLSDFEKEVEGSGESISNDGSGETIDSDGSGEEMERSGESSGEEPIEGSGSESRLRF